MIRFTHDFISRTSSHIFGKLVVGPVIYFLVN